MDTTPIAHLAIVASIAWIALPLVIIYQNRK